MRRIGASDRASMSRAPRFRSRSGWSQETVRAQVQEQWKAQEKVRGRKCKEGCSDSSRIRWLYGAVIGEVARDNDRLSRGDARPRFHKPRHRRIIDVIRIRRGHFERDRVPVRIVVGVRASAGHIGGFG